MRDVFGIQRLRPGQDEVIRSIMGGRNTLAIMPTGAGKSLCYQLPALHLDGTTLIVSPLISLMKDQVDKLDEAGLAALARELEEITGTPPANLLWWGHELRDVIAVLEHRPPTRHPPSRGGKPGRSPRRRA